METLAFPAEWVRQVDRDEAGALAGMPVARGGAYFAQGMLMQPGRLIETLLALPGVTVLPAQVARVHQDGGQWQALDAAGRELARADTMILANAAGARGVLDASGLLEPWLPRVAQMHALAGEVTLLPAAALEGGPRCIIGGEGYLLPDTGEGCVAGSTYVHGAEQALISAEGQQVTLGKAAGLLGAVGPAWNALTPGSLPGWAGWRAVSGRLPAVGNWPMPGTMDGRGLCLARPVLVRAHGRPDRRPPDGRTFAAGAGSGRIGDASMKGDAKRGNSYCDRPLLTGQSRKLRGFAARWARFHRAWQRLRGARTCRAGDRCQALRPFLYELVAQRGTEFISKPKSVKITTLMVLA